MTPLKARTLTKSLEPYGEVVKLGGIADAAHQKIWPSNTQIERDHPDDAMLEGTNPTTSERPVGSMWRET